MCCIDWNRYLFVVIGTAAMLVSGVVFTFLAYAFINFANKRNSKLVWGLGVFLALNVFLLTPIAIDCGFDLLYELLR